MAGKGALVVVSDAVPVISSDKVEHLVIMLED
jgi:hypothetical protein